MNPIDLEALARKYDYRIIVSEGQKAVTYFAESIDVSKGSYITFAPRYRISGSSKQEVKGEILTLPSHLVRKITHYVRT